jgi:hypothetical protein
MGHRVCQLLATLCVASSLTLVALHGSDLNQVLPLNPELWQTPQKLLDLFWIQLLYPTMHRVHRTRSQMTLKIIFTAPFYCA